MILVDPSTCWAACALLALAICPPAAAPAPFFASIDAAGPRVCAPRTGRGALRAHELITLRPAMPADRPAQRALCEALAPADLALFGAGAPAPGALAGDASALDAGGVGLVALRGEGAGAELVGMVRVALDPDGVAGEFVILVHPSARRRGLGRLLMERMLSDCRRRALLLVRAAALPRNTAMLALARASGFQLLPAADGSVELVMAMAAHGAGRAVRR